MLPVRLWACRQAGGGRTLSREAVFAVLGYLQLFFTENTWAERLPAKTVLASFERVVTLSISDANKKHMIDFEPLVDILLECLLLDESNHRHGQEGHDALQEASAGVIQELALYGPGCALLRSHGEVISSLHRLVEVGTKASKERGAGALFELDEEKGGSSIAISISRWERRCWWHREHCCRWGVSAAARDDVLQLGSPGCHPACG